MISFSNKYLTIAANAEELFLEVTNNNDFYNISGIYMIKNIVTKEVYIGQSKSVGNRLTGHISDLRHCRHRYSNKEYDLLQKSWNKYGESAFKFYLVTVCEISDLNKYEIFWISYFNCNHKKSGHGFNLTDGGDRPPIVITKGYKCLKDPTDSFSVRVPPDKIDEYLNQGYTFGRANNDEIVRRSTETKRKNGFVNPYKGKKHPKEWHDSVRGSHQSAETIERRRKKLINRTPIFLDDPNKIIEKRVKQEDLAEYLANGWKLGMSPNRKRKPIEECHYSHAPMSEKLKQQLRESKYKPVIKYDLNGNIVARYESLRAAAAANSISIKIAFNLVHNKIKKLSKYSYRLYYETV